MTERPMEPREIPLRVLDTDGRRIMPVAGSGSYLVRVEETGSNPQSWRSSAKRAGKIMLSGDFDRLRIDQPILMRVKTRGTGGKGSHIHSAARITLRTGPYRPPLPGPRFTESREGIADGKRLDTSSITRRQGYLRKQCAAISPNRAQGVLRYMVLIDQMLEQCPERTIMRSRVEAATDSRKDAARKTLKFLQDQIESGKLTTPQLKAARQEAARLMDLLGLARDVPGMGASLSPIGYALATGKDQYGRKVDTGKSELNLAVSAVSGTGLGGKD